jgi:hypothetical protein
MRTWRCFLVWDGHVAMVVENGVMIEAGDIAVQLRRHGIASAHFICPSKPSDVAIAR